MTKKSFRVFFVVHDDGKLVGTLLRTWEWFLDRPAPSAFGNSEDQVLAELEVQAHALAATDDDGIERYLWAESFQVRTVSVEIHPETPVKKRFVIGKRTLPLGITYLVSSLAEGGHRIMVPRFGWSFILEDLALAEGVLQKLVTTALLGKEARSIFDFRMLRGEYVMTFAPKIASQAQRPSEEDTDSFEELRKVADELVDRAAHGKVPAVLGSQDLFDRSLPLIRHHPPRPLLLVGGSGVGKTSFVHRLARHLLAEKRKKTEQALPRVWSTSVDRILSGMTYLGMWQERCLSLVRELEDEGDYLYAGDLPPLLRPQADGSSIADIFGPALAAGRMSLILECTEAELQQGQRRAASFLSCFEILRIPEPAPSTIPAFLAGLEDRRSATVRIHPAGKKRLVQHLRMFRKDQCFPGKAVRFLEWLYQTRPATTTPRTLYPRDVSEAYADYSGLPLDLIADEVPQGEDELTGRLGKHVIGQEAACRTAARVLARFKAGLNDPERPSGTLLFVGPTGVGKTELAKVLCRTMFGSDKRMVRLDMSEYMLPGSSARLIETGAGAQSLAKLVRDEPLCLVLFDEIEKAHREVFGLLLGVLGEGRLTDADGRLVDFRMALIVMTSNLGTADAPTVGFGRSTEIRPDRAVRRHFRPEFFNRIDQVVAFQNLGPGDVLRIVDLEIDKARSRTGLLRRNLSLDLSTEAKALLAERGFHPTRGARPLRRLIEERIITPIAARISAEPDLANATLRVDVRGSELELSATATPALP